MYRHIYIHFPFCEAKCHYCDFYSLGVERTRAGDPTLFEHALRMECEEVSSEIAPQLDSLFFGGGTPSMTSPDSMARALEPLWKRAQIHDQTEWTMEANPSSIQLESMKAFRKYGINRVSMGVQALRPDLLVSLGRVHSQQDAIRALGTVFESGFENVSVDLLCGVPGQGLSDLEKAMETLAGFPIQHLSCYLLTLPKHHKMFPLLPDEEEQLKHLLLIHDWMTDRGFVHYEISNFCRPGKQARHNLAYWKGKSYLGLGPSAHSYDAQTQMRWKNVSSLHKYGTLLEKNQLPREATEHLSDDQVQLEKWMLALRLSDGFPASWLSPQRAAKVQSFQQNGIMEPHPENPAYFRLTARGFAVSDQVLLSLA